jgi:hypothetical protein
MGKWPCEQQDLQRGARWTERGSSGYDIDEYPPAMFAEGGKGASTKPIPSSDNRGSGASMGNQLRPYSDGTKVIIDIE